MYRQMQQISITCIGIISGVLVLDANYHLLHVNTIFVLLYVIAVFFASIWSTFVFLQRVLATTSPLGAAGNKLLRVLHAPIQATRIGSIVPAPLLPVDERIEQFVDDVVQLCVRRWYSKYISRDEQFLSESAKLIDVVVRRFFHIADQIDADRVLHGTLTILLQHVRNYRKAAKKATTTAGGSVEEHYRFAHVGSESRTCFKQFAVQITEKTLRHFMHWELYNSLACRYLNAILAKKLVGQMVHYLAAPAFINHKLLSVCAPKEEFLQYQLISIGDASLMMEIDDCCEESTKETNCDVEKADKPVANETEEGEVKVYESKSANKTWRNSSDLDCISLGQDILILSHIVEEGNKPDWAQLAEDWKKNGKESIQPVVTAANALITNMKPTTSMKETMKDIQQSTSHTMHKFEDEAAGMVEGILDLGIAGIRKGLRLTGLQDYVLDARPKSECKDIPKSNKATRLAKLSHVSSAEEESTLAAMAKRVDVIRDEVTEEEEELEEDEEDEIDAIYMHPVAKEDIEGDILLEKSPMIEARTSSNESNASIVPTMEFLHVEDSPEPEYEDTTDLAATTAKLRSLLAQKTEANTPIATSPMSLIPTPTHDASGSSIEELSEVDVALPSMYRSWAKTATGVLQNTINTIKTALPSEDVANSAAKKHRKPIGDEQWAFVAAEPKDTDLNVVLSRVIAEREQFCVVDNAFEAVEAVDADRDHHLLAELHGRDTVKKYEDDLDEFDTKVPMTKATIDLLCELLEDTFPQVATQNIVKIVILLFGTPLEEQLHNLAQELVKSGLRSVGRLPTFDGGVQTAMPMTMADFVQNLTDALVRTGKCSWMDQTDLVSILTLVVSSLQSHRINVDTCLQLVELYVAEVVTACSQLSPTYSA